MWEIVPWFGLGPMVMLMLILILVIGGASTVRDCFTGAFSRSGSVSI